MGLVPPAFGQQPDRVHGPLEIGCRPIVRRFGRLERRRVKGADLVTQHRQQPLRRQVRALAPGPLGGQLRLPAVRQGLLEPAARGGHGRPAAGHVPSRQRGAEPYRDSVDRLDLGFGPVQFAELSERVEAPQPPPQHGVVVAVAAQRDEPVAERQPFGSPVRPAERHLPGPQRFAQRAPVTHPLRHGQRLGRP